MPSSRASANYCSLFPAGRSVLLLFAPLILSGCVHVNAFHIGEKAPVVDFNNPPQSRSYPQKIPVNIAPMKPDSQNVVTLEFDDSGRLVPCTKSASSSPANDCQLTRATDYIKSARSTLTPEQNLVVLTFIHGWHHNASWMSGNYRDFQRTIDCLNFGAVREEAIANGSVATKPPFDCGSVQPSVHSRYVGIYIGWRGESMQRVWGFLTYVSINDRFNGAGRVASQGDLIRVLERINVAAKQDMSCLSLGVSRENKCPQAGTVTVGHSFGGLVLSRIIANLATTNQAINVPTGIDLPHPISGAKAISDIAFVINPADNALRVADLTQRLKPSGQASPSSSGLLPNPTLISIHTQSDSATETFFPIFSHIWFWTDSKERRTFKWLQTPVSRIGDPTPTVGQLRSRVINAVPLLKNLCYLDQDRGADVVCGELNQSLEALKEQAYLEIVQKPAPQSVYVGHNPGAWELLTSICWEPNEDPSRPGPSKWDFPDPKRIRSCKEHPDLEALRKQLVTRFKIELAPFLAIPDLGGDPYGNALLDLYRRGNYPACAFSTSVNPARVGCQAPTFAWNDTSVWSTTISYENVQNHSGIWNSDVIAFLSHLTTAFPAP